MLERETGTSVATTTCPECGTTLEMSADQDGSVSAERCQACYPQTEKAAVPTPQRVKGTDVQEASK